MAKKSYFFHEFAIFWLAEKWCKEFFFPILHHLSPVIFANATVLAFVLLPSSRFNFHCYTQREPTPTQKLAQNWQLRPFATSCAKDYEGHSLLQTSFAEPPNTANSMQQCTDCGQHHRNWIATFLRVENHFLLGDTHRLVFIAVPYRKTQSTIWQRCCVPTAGVSTPHSWLLQGTRPRKILWHCKFFFFKWVTQWVHLLKRALWFTFPNGALSPVNHIG